MNININHRLIFRLAQNDLLSPDEASSGLLKLDFSFEMCYLRGNRRFPMLVEYVKHVYLLGIMKTSCYLCTPVVLIMTEYTCHVIGSIIKDPILDRSKDSLAVASAPAEIMPETTVAPPNGLTASSSNLLCL